MRKKSLFLPHNTFSCSLFTAFLLIMSVCRAQTPVITSVTPTVAQLGMEVIIKGTNLSGASAVSFGGTPAASFTVRNNFIISAVVGAGSSGSVSVTTLAGTATAGGFIFCNALPSVSVMADPAIFCTGSTVTLTAGGADNYVWPGGVSNGVPFIPVVSDSIFSSRLDIKVKADCGGQCSSAPQGVAIGDVDGDGKKDIVVTDFATDSIYVYRNTSNTGILNSHTFTSKVSFRTGRTPLGFTSPFAAVIADIDNDGKNDIIASNLGDTSITVFKNTGSPGTFNTGSLSAGIHFTAGMNPAGMGVADIDGDGKLDIVVANISNMSGNPNVPLYYISVFRNISTPGIIDAGSFAPRVDFPAGSSPHTIAIGDIDGDGKADIVTTNYESPGNNTISVFRNNSTPGVINTSSLQAKVDFITEPGSADAAIGDLDGDGKNDIAAVSSYYNTVSVFRNESTAGTINSTSLSSRVAFNSGSFPVSIVIADMNGDARQDMIVTNAAANSFSYYENMVATPGMINTNSFLKKEFIAGGSPRQLAVDDIDGDARPELVIANSADSSVSIFSNKGYYYPVVGSYTNGCPNTNWVSLEAIDCTPVPLHFISIGARKLASGIKINWKVTGEQGIAAYTIERSLQGNDFAGIGTIPVKETAGTENSYSYMDAGMVEGTVFYRVKSTNHNGSTTYSAVAKLDAVEGSKGFTIVPNTVKGSSMNVRFLQQPAGRYMLRVVNYTGQVVASFMMTHAGADAVHSIILPATLIAGMYYVEISGANRVIYRTGIQKLSN